MKHRTLNYALIFAALSLTGCDSPAPSEGSATPQATAGKADEAESGGLACEAAAERLTACRSQDGGDEADCLDALEEACAGATPPSWCASVEDGALLSECVVGDDCSVVAEYLRDRCNPESTTDVDQCVADAVDDALRNPESPVAASMMACEEFEVSDDDLDKGTCGECDARWWWWGFVPGTSRWVCQPTGCLFVCYSC